MSRVMKDSGIEWIGKIPKVWNLVKVKNLFSFGRGRVIAKTELEDIGYPVYSSQTKDNGVLGYISTYDFDKSQLTWTTDGANAGTVFLREGKYNCTNVCGTLLPKDERNNLRYMKYALEFIAIYHKRADTNGFKIMNNEMAEIKITLPLLSEQQKIADFLDEKVAEIDSAIEKTKATIEDYKKYKQSIITETVTKGLNPEVEMKDSGIEWVGSIPNNWETRKLKQCVYVRARLGWKGLKADEYVKEGYAFLSAFNIINNKLDFSEINYINEFRYNESPEIKLAIGDVLLVKDGAGIGKCAYVESLPQEATVNGSIAVLSSNIILKGKYLYYYLLSKIMQKYVDRLKDGMGVPHLFQRDIKEIKIPIPTVNEQNEIIQFLDIRCAEIDNMIKSKEAILSEFESYKKSLIYEYVTGKKEV